MLLELSCEWKTTDGRAALTSMFHRQSVSADTGRLEGSPVHPELRIMRIRVAGGFYIREGEAVEDESGRGSMGGGGR